MKKAICCVLFLVMAFSVSLVVSESATTALQEMYAEAELKMVTGDYTGAAEIFDKMGSYSDCSQMAMYCKAFSAAEDLGMYEIAVDTFTKLGEFKDCQQLIVYYTGRSHENLVDKIISNMGQFSDEDLIAAKEAAFLAKEKYIELALFKDSMKRSSACDEKVKVLEQELSDRHTATLQSAYDKAKGLEDEGKYLEAIKVYQTIADFKDSSERIDYCIIAYKSANYLTGEKKLEEKDWEGARRAFEKAGDYLDSSERIKEAVYFQAYDLRKAGKIKQSCLLYISIIDYKDVAQILEQDSQIREFLKQLDRFSFGSRLIFGKYGSGEIEWILIDKDGYKIKLVSSQAIDAMKFGTGPYETSDVRNYLINTIYAEAFSPEEKTMIVNDSETGDPISIPSGDDADILRFKIENHWCTHTLFAFGKGIRMGREYCWWGIRDILSNGKWGYCCAEILYNHVDFKGEGGTDKECLGIRPVIWLNAVNLLEE